MGEVIDINNAKKKSNINVQLNNNKKILKLCKPSEINLNFIMNNNKYYTYMYNIKEDYVKAISEAIKLLPENVMKNIYLCDEKDLPYEKYSKYFPLLQPKENLIFFFDVIKTSNIIVGFLVTSHGIHINDNLGKCHFYEITDILLIDTEITGIIINKESIVALMNKEDKDELVEFLKCCVVLLQQLDINNMFRKKNIYPISQSLAEDLRKCIKKLIDSVGSSDLGRFVSVMSSSNRAFTTAIKTFVNLESGEIPLFMFDDTLLCSGKNGIVITNKNLYFKTLLQKVNKIPLDNIKKIDFKGFNLNIDDKKIVLGYL
ncbi:MAG: hypothetical protein ACRC7R_07315, partial [Sarcina sp.]